ncbi:MAG: hypothetical protein J6Y85_00910 [Alphaproteobacteria bacterium]|nr:hypothetical protein [Alphaproteobacteria bacterium]
MELKKMNTSCPSNCPFLANRLFLPESLPFFCEKFEVYLGVDGANKVQRCSACLGVAQNVIQTGLSLLDAQLVPRTTISQLKKAFLDMPPAQQKNFVAILSQSGIQLKPNPYEKVTAFWLMRQAQHAWALYKKREESPEVQDFIKLLDVIGGDSPLDGMTKTLLSNIFQVLDGSEQAMLIAVLENPMNMKAFLKQLDKTPHDQDLLKNFRATLYEYHQNLSNQIGLYLAMQQQSNQIQQHGRVVANQQNKMRHILQKMTQVRANKSRS